MGSDGHDKASSSASTDGGWDEGTCQRTGDVAASLVVAAFIVDQSTGDVATSRRVGVSETLIVSGVVIEHPVGV